MTEGATIEAHHGGGPRSGLLFPIALGLVVFAVGLWGSAACGVSRTDEAWFVRVVDRVLAGDVLYRDISFGATPLSVWLTVGLAWVFGVQVLVLKALLALCLVARVLISVAILGCLGVRRRAAWIPILAIVVYSPVRQYSAYTDVAEVMALLGLWAAVSGRRPSVRAILVGLAAGASFAAKQNLGATVLAALLVTLWIRPRSEGIRAGLALGATALVAFTIAVVTMVAPVWLSGGLPGLLEYGLLGKGAYFADSQRWGYLDWGEHLVGYLRNPLEGFWGFHRGLASLLPPLAILVLAVALLTRRLRSGVAVPLALLVLALFANAYPRADLVHQKPASAVSVLALAVAMGVGRGARGRSWRRVGRAALYVWLGLGFARGMLGPIPALIDGRLRPSPSPHCAGVLEAEGNRNRNAADMRLIGWVRRQGRPAFLISPFAGYMYLAGGLENPTPFDYPFTTTLGRTGEDRLIEDVRRGRIELVVLDVRRDCPRLFPQKLIRHVRTSLREIHRDAGWVVFSRSD